MLKSGSEQSRRPSEQPAGLGDEEEEEVFLWC